MKGMVFTEFLEMVEDKFGFETADIIVEKSDLASGGAYTSVGTYDHAEMVSLVSALSQETNVPVPNLLNAYGKHLFGQFANGYQRFFSNVTNSFDFMGNIEDYIHVEVRKLYPDAELPRFDIDRQDENTLKLNYFSERGLADFAQGLIEGCVAHYNEKVTIFRTDIKPDGTQTEFLLKREAVNG